MDDINMVGISPWLKFIWEGHITNWLWRDRTKRRDIRNKSFFTYKAKYLDNYIPFIRSLKTEGNFVNREPIEDEKMFSIWFQGEEKAPGIIKACFQSVRNRYPDRFKVLNQKELKDYITLPDYIEDKFKNGTMGAPHYSDLCRIELLANYGGYWLDASCLMTGDISPEIAEQDFFMYVTSDRIMSFMFIQNCFIHSQKGHPLLMMWRELLHEYWRREKKAIHYFFGHRLFELLVKNNEEAARLFAAMPKITMDATHRLWNEIGENPYDDKEYEEMCRNAFFQKCNVKRIKGLIENVIPGSMAAHALTANSNIKDLSEFSIVKKKKDKHKR